MTIPEIVRGLCDETLSPTDAIAALNRIVAVARDVRPYRCTFAAAALPAELNYPWPREKSPYALARMHADAMIAELEANPLGEP